MEAFHLQVSEYIGIYKDRQNFLSKIQLEALKQKNKLEQMKLKHQMDLEKIEKSKNKDAIEVDNMKVPYSQEDLIKQLDEVDKG